MWEEILRHTDGKLTYFIFADEGWGICVLDSNVGLTDSKVLQIQQCDRHQIMTYTNVMDIKV